MSVLTPSGHITKLCEPESLPDSAFEPRIYVDKALRMYSYPEALVIDMLVSNGLRVSEVLNVRIKDVLSKRKFIVQGLKGSFNRVCTTSFLDIKVYSNGKSEDRIFQRFNRYYIRRVCDKIGLVCQVKGNEKSAVTHSARHLYVESLKNSGVSTDDIQIAIGHKNKKSTIYYEQHKPI